MISFLADFLTKAKEFSLSYDIPTAGKRRDGFMPFLRALFIFCLMAYQPFVAYLMPKSSFEKNSCSTV